MNYSEAAVVQKTFHKVGQGRAGQGRADRGEGGRDADYDEGTLKNKQKLYQDLELYFLTLEHLLLLQRRKQCDQMVRLFFNIWQFVTMKISPMMS